MGIQEALNALNQGKCVSNRSWNGAIIFLFKVFGRKIELEQFLTFKNGNSMAIEVARKHFWHQENIVVINDHIDAMLYGGSIKCGYEFTQEDLTSKNWVVIE